MVKLIVIRNSVLEPHQGIFGNHCQYAKASYHYAKPKLVLLFQISLILLGVGWFYFRHYQPRYHQQARDQSHSYIPNEVQLLIQVSTTWLAERLHYEVLGIIAIHNSAVGIDEWFEKLVPACLLSVYHLHQSILVFVIVRHIISSFLFGLNVIAPAFARSEIPLRKVAILVVNRMVRWLLDGLLSWRIARSSS